MLHRPKYSIICFALVLLTATIASATTVQVSGIPELVEGSSLIVEGRVTSVNSVIIDAGPGVFTEYRIAVANNYKGPHVNEVRVRIPGGKAERRAVAIEGMPSLQKDSNVLLILEPLPRKAWVDAQTPSYLPYGLEQGVFELSGDGATYTRPESGATLVYASEACTGGEHTRSFSADLLRNWIKHSLAQGGH